MTDLAAALLRDVPRYDHYDDDYDQKEQGAWVTYASVLAALSRALDPAIAEKAGALTKRLRKTEEAGHVHHLSKADRLAAADLITTLLTANAALRAERDDYYERWNDCQEKRMAAEAKVEKLRGACLPLQNLHMWTESAEDTEMVIVSVGTVRAIRAALTTEELT